MEHRMIETIHCLYCQTENTLEQDSRLAGNHDTKRCQHCGMALPKSHPNSVSHRTKLFPFVFGCIALFCFLMIIYLPR